MVNHETRTIEEVTEALIDYRGKTPPKHESGVRLITAKVIKDGFIREERAEYISDKTYSLWMSRGYPKQYDIVITTEAPLGEVAQLRSTEKIALAQRVILLRGNPKIIDQQFYYQVLKSPFVQAGLMKRATGTTVLGIKQSELRQVAIPYYSLPTQRKIAAILSAYDDLIENNLKRIKILEDMAQNLYREWFVKFRFPGWQNSHFIESPLGRIPEGWECGVINELLSLKSGFAFKSGTFRESGAYGLITIKNVQDGGFVPDCTNRISDLPPKMPIYCLLATGDVLLSLTGNIGRVCLVYGTNFLLNQRVAKLVPKEASNRAYIYFTFRQDEFQTKLTKIANGVAQQNLSPIETGKLPVVLPAMEVLNNFAAICEPVCEQITSLFSKNSILRRTSELLLPKLISGEVDVSELDIQVPEENL